MKRLMTMFEREISAKKIKIKQTKLGADYISRLGGLARLAEILARLRNTPKIKFAITWKNFSSVSGDPG